MPGAGRGRGAEGRGVTERRGGAGGEERPGAAREWAAQFRGRAGSWGHLLARRLTPHPGPGSLRGSESAAPGKRAERPGLRECGSPGKATRERGSQNCGPGGARGPRERGWGRRGGGGGRGAEDASAGTGLGIPGAEGPPRPPSALRGGLTSFQPRRPVLRAWRSPRSGPLSPRFPPEQDVADGGPVAAAAPPAETPPLSPEQTPPPRSRPVRGGGCLSAERGARGAGGWPPWAPGPGRWTPSGEALPPHPPPQEASLRVPRGHPVGDQLAAASPA